MKKLLRIKWENILTIFYGLFFTIGMIKHIIKNGFDADVFMLELMIYIIVLAMVYVMTYSFRENLKEWNKNE